MDRTQRNGGTAGLVTAVLLALLFVLILSIGLDPQAAGDPTKALPVISQKSTLWALTGMVGALAAAVATVFATGFFRRLRERAPTRAYASLILAVVGLGGHALAALVQWQGGAQLADYATKDQVAASHAWVALNAAIGGINAFASVFTGGSLLVAGWAIIDTGSLTRTVGWVGVIAGVLSVWSLFATTSPAVFLGSLVFAIVWLGWAGSELRRPSPATSISA